MVENNHLSQSPHIRQNVYCCHQGVGEQWFRKPYLAWSHTQCKTLGNKFDLLASVSTQVKMRIKITPHLWWLDKIIYTSLQSAFENKVLHILHAKKGCWPIPQTHMNTSPFIYAFIYRNINYSHLMHIYINITVV